MAYIDFESLSLDGNPQIVILPEPKDKTRHYFIDGSETASFECVFDHSDKNVKRFFNAIMLPERKFVRWRKKKMLVSKIPHRPFVASFNFDINTLKQRLCN